MVFVVIVVLSVLIFLCWVCGIFELFERVDVIIVWVESGDLSVCIGNVDVCDEIGCVVVYFDDLFD